MEVSEYKFPLRVSFQMPFFIAVVLWIPDLALRSDHLF
jgi:hypothetical protein